MFIEAAVVAKKSIAKALSNVPLKNIMLNFSFMCLYPSKI
jgi:hypothetical protein